MADTSLMTAWQRLRDEQGMKASYSSFRRYVQKHLPGRLERPHITVRREDPPPGEEAQIDFGYLGLWDDPVAGQRCRLWAFAMVLSHSRHMFACAVRHLDQRVWLESPKTNRRSKGWYLTYGTASGRAGTSPVLSR